MKETDAHENGKIQKLLYRGVIWKRKYIKHCKNWHFCRPEKLLNILHMNL